MGEEFGTERKMKPSHKTGEDGTVEVTAPPPRSLKRIDTQINGEIATSHSVQTMSF